MSHDKWGLKNITTSLNVTFTIKEQQEIHKKARSAWQIGIIIGQVCFIFTH